MGGGGGHPAPPHPFILQICVLSLFLKSLTAFHCSLVRFDFSGFLALRFKLFRKLIAASNFLFLLAGGQKSLAFLSKDSSSSLFSPTEAKNSINLSFLLNLRISHCSSNVFLLGVGVNFKPLKSTLFCISVISKSLKFIIFGCFTVGCCWGIYIYIYIYIYISIHIHVHIHRFRSGQPV